MGKRLHKTGAIVFLLVSSTLSNAADHVSANATPCDPWAAKIASVQGQVESKRHSQSTWQAVSLNQIYCPGDQIRVGDNARAAIVLNNDTLVRLNQNSAITLAEIKSDGPSLLELLEGIAHFISRVPRSLKVNTPFVNAAIEGTEFVVAIGDKQTEVTVFEGVVLTQNTHGELRITQNETAVASANSAPQKVLKAAPRDAVQWALYFPPIFDQAQGKLATAQQLLFSGQVEAARAELKDESSAEALSLLSIIAVVQNDADGAVKSASQAVEKAPQLAAAHIALSYAWQAKRELNQSLASAQRAVNVEQNNALAWARVAELQLSTGDLSDALQAAQRATQLNPTLARTQTILGFAHLLQIDIAKAKDAFNKAIELDQVDPLPRLGLGLAKIRQNELAEGRRDIEIAASLDPNNAIIRSYLGKAYFEEKRAPLDAEQFAMAKELDPNDPTPWFYDAIRKQTENDPVGALDDINKSIVLNDNRAVYRSSLQLDQDEAARSASLARIYQELGFQQLARLEGVNSLLIDPANYSAHRFLSDTYATLPRHEISRVSELLQAQLFQPLNPSPLQPTLAISNLPVIDGTGPSSSSINDLNNLFVRNDLNVQLNGVIGTNETIGNDLILSGISNKLSYSLSQYHYETDGYRVNNDQKHDVKSAIIQAAASSNTNIQVEVQSRKSVYGDLEERFAPEYFLPQDRTSIDTDTARFGLNHKLKSNSQILFSLINKNSKENYFQFVSELDPGVSQTDTQTSTNVDNEGTNTELQYVWSSDNYNILLGAGYFNQNDINYIDGAITINLIGIPVPPTVIPIDVTISREIQHANLYTYSNIRLQDSLFTLGFSYDDYEDVDQDTPANNVIEEAFSPKFGYVWNISDHTKLRFAAFRSLKPPLLSSQTLQPTHIAGFSQFYDDVNASDTTRYGLGLDHQFSKSFYAAVEFTQRKIIVPSAISTQDNERQDELLHNLHINWNVTSSFSLSTGLVYDSYSSSIPTASYPVNLITRTFPIDLSYFVSKNYYYALHAAYVNQYMNFSDAYIGHESPPYELSGDFWNFDLELGYKLSNRKGKISFIIKNLFDEDIRYQDRNFQTVSIIKNQYLPERAGYVNINLLF